jgi:general secretion pathway protein J
VSRRRAQAGFTLLEVMIAMAILAFMMSMAWYTVNTTARAKDRVEARQLRNHEIRVAMEQLVRDIESAYISANENQNAPEQRTHFIGKSHGTVDELRFSSLGHRVLWANANESSQTLISYSAESDRKNPGTTNLIRREARRLTDEQWEREPAELDILLRDVSKVRFEYYDWKDQEWKDTWDSTKADAQRGRLPLRVKIEVEVPLKDRSETITFTTQARIMMQEELRFHAN